MQLLPVAEIPATERSDGHIAKKPDECVISTGSSCDANFVGPIHGPEHKKAGVAVIYRIRGNRHPGFKRDCIEPSDHPCGQLNESSYAIHKCRAAHERCASLQAAVSCADRIGYSGSAGFVEAPAMSQHRR